MGSPAMRNLVWYWLAVGIYAGFIFYISSLPAKDIPGLFPCQDIVFHFLEYAVFAWLIIRAVTTSWPQKGRREKLLLVMFLAFLYALSDEFHQSFVPGRTASWLDVAVDATGSFFTTLSYRR